MAEVLSFLRKHVGRMQMAYLVLVIALLPVPFVHYRVRVNIEGRNRARLERVTHRYRGGVEKPIARCVVAMQGVRGLVALHPSVSTEQWQNYVSSFELGQSGCGMRILGYIEQVPQAEQKNFLRRARAIHGPDYQIFPLGERPVSFPVFYACRVVTTLQNPLGLDHFANPDRRTTLETARDTGQPAVTLKVGLMTKDENNQAQSGFVIYLPVYRVGAPTATVEDRRAALQGFVFASFDAEKLLSGVFSPTNALLNVEVYDGSEIAPEHLLYIGEKASVSKAYSSTPDLSLLTTIPVLNRNWTIRFSALPAFQAESLVLLPMIALVSSAGFAFLLFGIACAQVKARERAEQISAALQKSEAALAAEKERLAVTLDSIGDAVITTDTNGRVLSINQAAEQLTRWKQTEVLGRPLTEIFRIFQEKDHVVSPNPVQEVLQTSRTVDPRQTCILQARDGGERFISDSAAPIRNKQGAIVGVVLVFRDVTERQKSEAELLKANKLESVGLLAGGIAHDFNNILLGIIGNLSMARVNVQSPEFVLERLVGVEKAATRAKDLTHQLVMFARGGAPIRKKVRLPQLIRDAALLSVQDSNAYCEFALAAELWPAQVDEGQFRQVINNIVHNAVQAMPDGGKIEVRAANVELAVGMLPPLNAGKYVKISIEDQGAGIPPEHLAKIFDPYFSTRKQSRGLGLASAYSVVRKHDGQISVESRVGRGSTFHILLPASCERDAALLPELDQKSLVGHGRILVMDDEPDLQELVREMLKIMGYTVETAQDGAEAIQRYEAARQSATPFAAVIMDLTVPQGMGGKEAIRRLKELDPAVKGIVSSGYSYDPVMANFRDYGFSGVIPKPYVMEDLARILQEVLSQKQSQLA